MNKIIVFSIALLLSFGVIAQHNVSGIVKDAQSNEVLIGAHVINLSSQKVCATDEQGRFMVNGIGKFHIKCTFIGYQPYSLDICPTKDTLIIIALEKGNELLEVNVQGQRISSFNTASLSIKELQQIPSLGSKPDVLKTMQMLPGIQGQSESSSMLIVRGGSPGENLYLLDHSPLLYVNHLGGFMSVFNPDMMNHIDVYKGGFPSRYGGKLSSIVNITQKTGNSSKFKGSYCIGITDLSLSLEGPLNEKSTFIFTGRKTLFDILLYSATRLSGGNSNSLLYGFHDFNLKYTYKPSVRNNYYVNAYQGDDMMLIAGKKSDPFVNAKTKNNSLWGNWMVASGWNTMVSAKLSGSTRLSFSSYRTKQVQAQTQGTAPDYKSKFKTQAQQLLFQSHWKYGLLSWWEINAGVQASFYMHTPYWLETSIAALEKQVVIGTDPAVYVENKWSVQEWLSLTAGMRLSSYFTNGYAIKKPEPRINLTISPSGKHQLHASYMETSQFSHLLFTPGSIMTSEVWVPATENVPAAHSKQGTLSFRSHWLSNMFTTEITGYYKQQSNLATYKAGEICLQGDKNWQGKIETGGKGESYGIELLVKKQHGNWTGNLGYSWSKTIRQYAGLNNGKVFPYSYDRPHCVSISVHRKLSEKWSLNLAWVYQSGMPYTPVLGRYYTPAIEWDMVGKPFYYEALHYGERNSGRMKAYHRLDVSFTYKTLTNKRKLPAEWSFGVYNAYARQNPNIYYYNSSVGEQIFKPELGNAYESLNLYQLSLFPFIPSFSYKVYFGKGDFKKGREERKKNRRAFWDKILYVE
jgi:hypothetical protein